MAWPPAPRRRSDPELMDAPGLPPAEVTDAYRVLRRVNRQFFGSLGSLRGEVRRFLDEERPGSIALLDVGSGSGDLPEAIRRDLAARGLLVATLSLDRDPTAIALARRAGLDAARGDALRLPFGDRSIDLVTAAKFAHHFDGEALIRLLAEMARVARRRVIIVDIRRDWLAYWGFVAWSRAFTRNRLVRHDGPLSVLRGFTRRELELAASEAAGYSWVVRHHLGFQLALVGKRSDGGIHRDR